MNTYDVKCPVCGVVNHSLLLEETDGWMECEHCGHTAKYCWEPQTKKQIPVSVSYTHLSETSIGSISTNCLEVSYIHNKRLFFG